MKTFDQCKDEVANVENYVTWAAFEAVHFYGTIKWRECNAKAAELYAQGVAKDAFDAGWRFRHTEIGIRPESSQDKDTYFRQWNNNRKPPYQPNQEKP